MTELTGTLMITATGYTEKLEVNLLDFEQDRDGNLHMLLYQGEPVEYIQFSEVILDDDGSGASIHFNRWKNPDSPLEWYPENFGNYVVVPYGEVVQDAFDPEEIISAMVPDLFNEAIAFVPKAMFKWVDHRNEDNQNE